MTDILVERQANGITVLTLNRPEALNACTYPMYEQFIEHLEAFRVDAQVRVIILTGAGRAFCAGHDLRSSAQASWDDPALGSVHATHRRLDLLARIPVLMRQLPQPVIAAVNGPAAGIGFVFALAADLCIAAASAKFVNALHNVGIGHELGMSWMLPRAIGTQRAAEVLLTGRSIAAQEAADMGMVLKVVPDQQSLDVAQELAARILANAPLGISLVKQSLWLNQGIGSLESACAVEARAVAMSRQTEDAAEKRRAFMESRVPVFINR